MLTLDNQVIFTPTKSGTMSLEAALKKLGWHQRMPRHGSQLLHWMDGQYHAHLILRNPYHRLRSMFTYGLLKNHPTLVGWAQGRCFTTFLRSWVENRNSNRPNHDWTTRYIDYYQACGRDDRITRLTTHRIEDGTARIVKELTGLDIDEVVKNTSAERVEADVVWTDERISIVALELEDDCKLGDYSPPA